MPSDADPVVGNWYRLRGGKGQQFEVVALDEEDGVVGVQHFDGDMEQFDLDTWYEMDLEPIEPPEDWTGPLDDIERDDLDYSDGGMTPDDWAEPLREHRPEQDESED